MHKHLSTGLGIMSLVLFLLGALMAVLAYRDIGGARPVYGILCLTFFLTGLVYSLLSRKVRSYETKGKRIR